MSLKTGEINFKKWKLQTEEKMDRSKKGSVDQLIVDLIKLINNMDEFCTTSSCSGRICILSDIMLPLSSSNSVKHKNCHFYLVSHDVISISNVQEVLKNVSIACKLKFEGFVLHVRCKTLTDAQKMLSAAIAAGFRNSGITLGKNCQNIIVGIRGTLCLEVPLTNSKGKLMVDAEYLAHVIDLANEKLLVNSNRINIFQSNVEKLLHTLANVTSKSKCDVKKSYTGVGIHSASKTAVCKQLVPDNLEDDIYLLFDDAS